MENEFLTSEQDSSVPAAEEKIIVHKRTGKEVSESDIKGENKNLDAIKSMTLLVQSGAYVWKGDKIEVDADQGVEIISAEIERLTAEREAFEKEKAEFDTEKENLESMKTDLRIKMENLQIEREAFEKEKAEFGAENVTYQSKPSRGRPKQ